VNSGAPISAAEDVIQKHSSRNITCHRWWRCVRRKSREELLRITSIYSFCLRDNQTRTTCCKDYQASTTGISRYTFVTTTYASRPGQPVGRGTHTLITTLTKSLSPSFLVRGLEPVNNSIISRYSGPSLSATVFTEPLALTTYGRPVLSQTYK